MASPLSLSQVFFIPSCDWAIWPHIERHISGESFTALNVQFSDSCIESGSAGEASKSVVKKWPEIWTFICNSKPIWNGQAGCHAACASQIDQRTIPKSSLTFGIAGSRSPWASYHFTKLFLFILLSYYVNLGLSFAHGRLSFRNNVRDISQS